MKRKSVSPKTRFEIFKRDKFTCQYCGGKAPDVLLRCDHVEPVSKGGSDDVTNLITSCIDCNSGKGAIRLSDSEAIKKNRAQIEELQERRAQLEMIMNWRKSLINQSKDAAEMASSHFEELFHPWMVNDSGRKQVARWIKKFSFEEVLSAIETASSQYQKTGDDGKITLESSLLAFSKIPGICRMGRLDKQNPEMREFYYTRGILKNRFPDYFTSGYCQKLILDKIIEASEWMSIEEIKACAKSATSVFGFETMLINRRDKNA